MIYQQDDTKVSINAVPAVFKPAVGPFKLTYLEKVFGTDPALKVVSARSGRHFQPEAAAHAAQNFGSKPDVKQLGQVISKNGVRAHASPHFERDSGHEFAAMKVAVAEEDEPFEIRSGVQSCSNLAESREVREYGTASGTAVRDLYEADCVGPCCFNRVQHQVAVGPARRAPHSRPVGQGCPTR
ncbi:hypothetical protein [Paenarthrobacter nitroguajacolicus]|uniref:hypothetical protein n=1 Tax=Paenarthrobacter nitroguajacolicus TaxID=211146 RepID=UPI00351D90D2